MGGKFQIIDQKEELNRIGCEFFINAVNEKIERTSMTSMELRWLTIKPEKQTKAIVNISNSTTFDEKQTKAINIINECSNESNSHGKELRMDVLLYKNPIKLKDNKHIIKLINAGADVRFKEMNDDKNNKVRLCLSGKRLFVSYAHKADKVVESGFLYEGIENDPMINYYKKNFDNDFYKARKIIVKNNKLSYEDNLLFRTIAEISLKDIIVLFCGGIIAILIKLSLG